jgi:hypothetical protein
LDNRSLLAAIYDPIRQNIQYNLKVFDYLVVTSCVKLTRCQGAAQSSSLDRLAWVAVFATTGYNGTERYGKPFNPILGETFEYCDKEAGIRFVAEQVSFRLKMVRNCDVLRSEIILFNPYFCLNTFEICGQK